MRLSTDSDNVTARGVKVLRAAATMRKNTKIATAHQLVMNTKLCVLATTLCIAATAAAATASAVDTATAAIDASTGADDTVAAAGCYAQLAEQIDT
eukprot:6399-Heterococcus_DN1.PRE.1